MKDQPENTTRITLTDVMLGIKRLSLINKVHYSHFAFFWGIIMEANEIGFKNPIELTTRQAIAAGGGSSRQAVSKKRKALEKYMINGERLLTVESGDPLKNTCAKYDINYELLLRNRGDSPSTHVDTSPATHVDPPSSTVDAPYDATDDATDDDPKIREERDKNTTTTTTTSSIPDQVNEDFNVVGIGSDIIRIQNLVKSKWPNLAPSKGVPPVSKVEDAIKLVDGDANKLEDAINRMPGPATLKVTSYHSIMKTVVQWSENPKWGLPDGAETNNGRYMLPAIRNDDRVEEDAYYIKSRTSMKREQALELVRTFEFEYLKRQVRQIKRDYEGGKRYRDAGAEVARRAKSGYEPPDYPERSEV